MKKPLYITMIVLWVMLVSLSFFFLFKDDGKNRTDEIKLIEIWHIDMFEGGTGSRKDYLKRAAENFSKGKNLVVSVINHTEESLKENLKKGVYPHMISYSQGLDFIFDYLSPLTLDFNKFGGGYGGKTYGLAWALGGYYYIEKDDSDILYISEQPYTLPYIAAILSGMDLTNANYLPSEEAFNAFLSKKGNLIGTQRDLYRLKNKNITCSIKPLTQFTDIIQYISIVSSGNNHLTICNDFLTFLVSSFNESIYKIGFLSPHSTIKNADNSPISPYLHIKYQATTSLFYSKNQIDNLKEILKSKNIDDDNKMKYIKNAVFYLK